MALTTALFPLSSKGHFDLLSAGIVIHRVSFTLSFIQLFCISEAAAHYFGEELSLW